MNPSNHSTTLFQLQNDLALKLVIVVVVIDVRRDVIFYLFWLNKDRVNFGCIREFLLKMAFMCNQPHGLWYVASWAFW